MTPLARKPESDYDRITGEILWLESLLDSLADEDIESVIEAVGSLINLKRKERER